MLEITILSLWGKKSICYILQKLFTENCPLQYASDGIAFSENIII
jgi:hypothetical protein